MERLLGAEERDPIRTLVERRMREFRTEIHHTDLAAYRLELRQEESLLEKVAQKLGLMAPVA